MHYRIFIILLLPVLFASCAIKPTSVSLTDAIDGVTTDMSRHASVSFQNVATWTPGTKWYVTQYLRKQQCKQHTADPVISLINGEISLEVSGNYTVTGDFAISTTSTIPGLSLNSSASKAVSQEIHLPVMFFPFSQLPEKLLEKQLHDSEDIIKTFQNDDSVRSRVIAGIKNNYTVLLDLVTAIVPEYDAATCPKKMVVDSVVSFSAKK